jgi:hypothetical protein
MRVSGMVCLSGDCVVLRLTVNSRRTNDVSLNHISMLGTGFEDDFVNVAVEG